MKQIARSDSKLTSLTTRLIDLLRRRLAVAFESDE